MASTGGLFSLALLSAYLISKTMGNGLKEAIQRRRLRRDKRKEKRAFRREQTLLKKTKEKEQKKKQKEKQKAIKKEGDALRSKRSMRPPELRSHPSDENSSGNRATKVRYTVLGFSSTAISAALLCLALIAFIFLPLAPIESNVETIPLHNLILEIGCETISDRCWENDGISNEKQYRDGLFFSLAVGFAIILAGLWFFGSDDELTNVMGAILIFIGTILALIWLWGALALGFFEILAGNPYWIVELSILAGSIWFYIQHDGIFTPAPAVRTQQKSPRVRRTAEQSKRLYREDEEHTPLGKTPSPTLRRTSNFRLHCSAKVLINYGARGGKYCKNLRSRESKYCGSHRCRGKTLAGRRCKSKKTSEYFCKTHYDDKAEGWIRLDELSQPEGQVRGVGDGLPIVDDESMLL